LASALLAALGGCQRRTRISVVASIEMKRRPSNTCRASSPPAESPSVPIQSLSVSKTSDGWAFLTSVSAPRFPIQRVTWMGFLDRGQSKVIGFLCSTAVSFRPSSRPRRNSAISLGQHHFYSCGGPLLTVAPVPVPSCPPCSAASAARGRFLLFCDATPTIHSN